MQYDKIKTRPVQFVGITGLKVEDFNFLLLTLKQNGTNIMSFSHWMGFLVNENHIQELIPLYPR